MRKPAIRLLWWASLMAIVILALSACTRPATTRPLPTSENVGQAGTPGTPATAPGTLGFPALQQTSVAQTATARARGGTPAVTAAFTPRPLATATPPPAESPQPTTAPTTAPGGQTYTVQPGDTLFSIALSFGLTVEELAQANQIADPSTIYAGQVLVIPSPGGGVATATPAPTQAGQRTYVVQEGDNCFRIALSYNLTCEQLAAANGLTPPDYTVYPGQVLIIP